jgi:hypothetical protein
MPGVKIPSPGLLKGYYSPPFLLLIPFLIIPIPGIPATAPAVVAAVVPAAAVDAVEVVVVAADAVVVAVVAEANGSIDPMLQQV